MRAVYKCDHCDVAKNHLYEHPYLHDSFVCEDCYWDIEFQGMQDADRLYEQQRDEMLCCNVGSGKE